jgi:hypothetical protein
MLMYCGTHFFSLLRWRHLSQAAAVMGKTQMRLNDLGCYDLLSQLRIERCAATKSAMNSYTREPPGGGLLWRISLRPPTMGVARPRPPRLGADRAEHSG